MVYPALAMCLQFDGRVSSSGNRVVLEPCARSNAELYCSCSQLARVFSDDDAQINKKLPKELLLR